MVIYLVSSMVGSMEKIGYKPAGSKTHSETRKMINILLCIQKQSIWDSENMLSDIFTDIVTCHWYCVIFHITIIQLL